MKILFCVLLIIFLYLNYKIVKKDYSEEKIPNKYLLGLIYILPFWYIVLFQFGNSDIHLVLFSVHILLTFIVSYALYEFKVWSAGDVKYLCILWLFIPHIWVLDLIWNIWITTLIYLMGTFIWFWLGPNLWNSQKRKDFYGILWTMKKNEFLDKNKNLNFRKILFKSLKWLNIFLILFISLRFLRMYVTSYIETKYDLSLFIENYGTYFIIWILIFTLVITLWVKTCLHFLRRYLFSSLNKEVYFICAISFIGIFLLLYGYSQNPVYFSEKIILIFTLYLALYLLIKTFWEGCKIIFKIQEQPMVHVTDLKEGMTIDTSWFNLITKRDKHILWDVQISWEVVTKEDIDTIKDVLDKIAEQEGEYNVPTLKTFWFAGYIFLGFWVTVLYGSLPALILQEAYQILFLH